MQVDVRNLSGDITGTLDLDERVFGIEPNRAVLHQAVVAQLANRRQGTADTKTRAEVAGGGKKPYRQKGTGRARQGSIRAPHYRGGGVVFGPHPRSYHQQLPRKMRRLALRSALSDKMANGSLTVIANLDLADARTKTMLGTLQALDLTGRTIIVLAETSQTARLASRNIEDVWLALPNGLSVLEVMQAKHVVLSQAAIPLVVQHLLEENAAAVAA